LLRAADRKPYFAGLQSGRGNQAHAARQAALQLGEAIVALDRNGDLYIAMYTPSIIYRNGTDGSLFRLYEDWEQLRLIAPTNIAFGGRDLKTLIVASLCGWSVHTAPCPSRV
jgi:sugar lactone lactonase YvrE